MGTVATPPPVEKIAKTGTFQVARYETPPPEGVMGTYGDRAIRWAKREIGLVALPWQADVIRKVLRYGHKGDLIHNTALVGCARQNGKSIIVRTIIGWLLDEGRTLGPFREWPMLLAAAHDAKQARIIYGGVFRDLAGIERLRTASRGARYGKDVKLTELFGIRVGDLEFDIVTSQPSSILGKSAGMIAWDEVKTQTDHDMVQALSPTMSAQRSPLMLLTSTAGNPESVVLREYFDRLVKASQDGGDPGFYGAWWQSTEAPDTLDWGAIEEANPALRSGRLSRAFIENEFRTYPADVFKQERLNHWADTVSIGAFNPAQWAACQTPNPPLEGHRGPFALGVEVGQDWQRATITVAAKRADGRIGVEVWRDLRGQLTAAQVITAAMEFPYVPQAVVYDGISAGAPSFRRHKDETGYPWDELTSSAVVAACMDTAEMVTAGTLAVSDPLISAQVAWTARKEVGTEGAFRFSRKLSSGPIDAVMAMSWAAHSIARSADIGFY